jgi:hypothetical protein
MEKNQVLAVAAGVGAVGTLMGYLGYSYLTNKQSSLYNEVEVDDNDANVSLTEEKSQQLTTMWQKFWKTEYNDINKKVEQEINDKEDTALSAEE